jgi:hypothetical protein
MSIFDTLIIIAVLGAAVWQYKLTWKIIKFFYGFFKAKKYRHKCAYISFLGAAILGVIISWLIILFWFLVVYMAHMGYYRYHNLKYKKGFENAGFNPAPYFLAEQKGKGAKRLLFANTQTIDYWYNKKSALEVNFNSNISYIGYGPKRTTMIIVVQKPISHSTVYKDTKTPIRDRFEAVFSSLDINIKVKKVIDTYAALEILFDSHSSLKTIEGKKDEVMRRLGVELETGYHSGLISWKIIHSMSIYRFFKAFKDAKKPGKIPVLIGKAEKDIVIDVIGSFHWLIVGSTGGGKSNIVNCLIAAMLMNPKRDIAKYYFLDPKEVELIKYRDFGVYRGQKSDIMAELRGLEKEMNARYTLMAAEGVDEISKCKKRVGYKIVIIEEIADMMLDSQYKKEFADIVQNLSQKSRAAGFRLFLITQAPYKDVIKGPIKVNCVNRIVGPMPDKPASIIALGDGRATELSGEAGEVILKTTGFNDRVKTPWMSEDDIEAVFNEISKKVKLIKG